MFFELSSMKQKTLMIFFVPGADGGSEVLVLQNLGQPQGRLCSKCSAPMSPETSTAPRTITNANNSAVATVTSTNIATSSDPDIIALL